MSEIAKLRQRLSNVNRGTSEYRMTVVEAKRLLNEVEELIKENQKPREVVVNEPTIINRITDGGAFL